ncbi:DnaJ homolog subfamily C member 2-like protein, partial [Tanacetum coccineum]
MITCIHPGGSKQQKGKKKNAMMGNRNRSLCFLLGLANLRYLATEEQIRKSYRETALKHHPDKQAALLLGEATEAAKEAKKDEIENHFKAIQEAYELLMDPVRRRIYDSTDEFDDEIPTDCSPQDFFKVFGPAFMRNGRCFKSWREFPSDEDFDLEQAESRDHRRWMERQNAKNSEKARKDEHTRIRSLVDNAYKRDPRIIKLKEMIKAEKQKKKEAKYMVKKQQEEEAARIAAEDKRKKEEEEKQAAEAALNQKKLKEKEKKLLRRERTRLRLSSTNVVANNLLNITQDDVENICLSFDMLQLQNLCENMEGKDKDNQGQAELLKEAINSDSIEKDRAVNNSQQNGSVKGKVNGTISTTNVKEEIELLRKGTAKYPKGTSRRWEVISEYIGTGRSVEEILKATKIVLLQKPDSSKAFDTFLDKRKPT